MSRQAKWIIVIAALAALGGLSLLPLGCRKDVPHGSGSMRHARKWKEELAACSSLEDVRNNFNCERWESSPEGGDYHIEDPNTYKEGSTSAFVYSLSNGDWLAMAYASSHGWDGGGTVVTRDSTGKTRVFFGHVCGRPHAVGESLEEIYLSLNSDNREWNRKEIYFNE